MRVGAREGGEMVRDVAGNWKGGEEGRGQHDEAEER